MVLAIGADPIQVPLAGNARDRILSVNDLSDCTRFRKAIEGARHLIVMGAGLIGCEFANDLYNAGIGVEALYYANNSLEGFALTGSAVQQKNDLTKQLPPFLA